MNEAVNKGYLLENYRLFHLKDRRELTVEPHFHEFNKIVLLLSGAVDYTIEGVCYRMQPGDLLFVRHHDIHRPVISSESVYERVILWIAPDYLERCSLPEEPLSSCFERTPENRQCQYRLTAEHFLRIKRRAEALETALREKSFGHQTDANACFQRFMVECCRCALGTQPLTQGDIDPKINEVLRYINTHLSEQLSVEQLAAVCYLSRYHFMRRFKETTGYTVHSYIQQKRLAAAAERIEEGCAVTEAALEAGFHEYSSFLRAFRTAYGTSPSDYLRQKKQMESVYRE